MIAYFLVKVIVLFGLGSSGKMDRPSVDQTVVVDVFCTAHDFLDTVIAIFAPTCGSQRSAIGAPRPSVGVVF